MSTVETTEETLAPATEAAVETPEHDHAHDHDHAHHHHHGPTLNPELTRSIEVEAPAEDVDKAFRKVIKQYTKMARIPGFRPGKVPETLIKSRFGREVREQVLESLVSERFREALATQTLQPVSQPQVTDLQLVEGQPLHFKATFEVLPEVNIDGYDTVSATKPDVTIDDAEYQAELDAVLEHHATVEPVEEERPLVDGDFAEISFVGKMKPLPEGQQAPEEQAGLDEEEIKGDDILLEIGGKNTLPAFSEHLRGVTPGQELHFEVDYPADFGDARLQGRSVSYEVQLKAIKKKTFPERDEEFAKELGPYESWEDFETKLRERVTERKRERLETEARDKMLDELIEKFHFPVPEFFVQQQIDARLDRGLRALAQQGMTQEQMRQLNFQQLRDAQRDQAIVEVKASLILDKVAEREGVDISEAELDNEVLMMSLQSREPYEALRKRLNDDGSIGRLREQMRREKTGVQLYERLAK